MKSHTTAGEDPVDAKPHPVLEALKRQLRSFRVSFGANCPDEGMLEVIARGKPFIGIERPKGFRHQMRAKNCYGNAASVALQGRATYVEGFILGRCMLIPHAWLTLDGEHAIDQTLHAPDHLYYGVAFTREELAHALCAQGWGLGTPLKKQRVGEPTEDECAAVRAESERCKRLLQQRARKTRRDIEEAKR